MVDFNGFDKGVIGKKLPSDSTLNNMKKSELIELLHLAESNHRVLAETYKIAVDTSKCKSCPLTLDEKDRIQVRTGAIDDCMTILKAHHQFRTCEDDYNPKIERPFYQSLWNRFEQLKEQCNE